MVVCCFQPRLILKFSQIGVWEERDRRFEFPQRWSFWVELHEERIDFELSIVVLGVVIPVPLD